MPKNVCQRGKVNLRILCSVLGLTIALLALMGILRPLHSVPDSELRIVEQLTAAEPTYSWQYTTYAGGLFLRAHITGLTLRKGGAFSTSDLALLRELPELRELTVLETPVSDDVLKEVCALRNLQNLTLSTRKEYFRMNVFEMMEADKNIPRAMFSDSAFARLGNLRHLRWLELSGVAITDSQIKRIERLGDLEVLSLRNARLTRHGIRALGKLHNLRLLSIGTVEDEDVVTKILRQTLPQCKLFVFHWKIKGHPSPGE